MWGRTFCASCTGIFLQFLTGTDKEQFVSYVSNSPLSLTYKEERKG